MDLRPVLYLIGLLLAVLSAGMVVAAATDIYYSNADWVTFTISALFTGFFATALILSCQQKDLALTHRQAFLFTGLSWLTMPLFAALPFLFNADGMSLVDAVFESVSGMTTTGATVITNIETQPPGLLIWRALLQWMGGIGIIVMAISVLPMLQVGGMQLFRLESSENEKVTPRFNHMVRGIAWIYLGLSVICAYAYYMAGMDGFDAIAHAMTTISTGGFSTFDTSFAAHDSVWPEYVCILFMWLGCLPFILYLKGFDGNWSALLRDQQSRGFFMIIGLLTLIIMAPLFDQGLLPTETAIRQALFTVTALVSGTGYANADYMQWGGFAMTLLFFAMCVGGCAGSTSCGIKIFRFQILGSVARNQIRKLVYPNGVFPAKYNGQKVSTTIALSVLGFVFVYALSFAVIAVCVSATGVDFLTAMSASLASLSNVGPGMGDIVGPTGTYAPLNDTAKWILSGAMLLGRLELFTLLVLLAPAFWRR